MKPNKTLTVGAEMSITVGALDNDSPQLGYQLSGCTIQSNLIRGTCKHCGQPECCYSCDMSVASITDSPSNFGPETEIEVASRLMFNGSLDGIETLTMACACAGIDITSNAFIEAVETAVDYLIEK